MGLDGRAGTDVGDDRGGPTYARTPSQLHGTTETPLMDAQPLPRSAARDYSVSVWAANLYALALILPLGAVMLAAHNHAHGIVHLARGFDDWLVGGRWLVGLGVGVVTHEFLHGLAWRVRGGAHWSSIRFGFSWKALSPYAHCRVPMTARAYRVAAATPGIVLGLVPALVGVTMGWGMWTAFGFLFTVAAGGDAVTLWVLRNVPGDWLVEDHPSQAGCLVYAPVEVAPEA
ncbi:MAG: DUF3267 domain-containing protein [Bacteroidota bacterium]